MSELEPITREEVLLDSVANGTPSNLTPITRQEIYLSAIAGETELPSDMKPITREEEYYQKILDNGGAGGGGEAEGTVEINITQNGTITRNVARYASAEITTNVPNSYEASDEGKVVSNGALASQTSRNVTANGTYDTTVNDEVVVNVPNPSTGTKQITSNGTHDVTDYASAQVNVPNSYSASDEGKVVSNGALVGQTSRQITANGTVDTTLNDEVVVNVPTGITPSGSQEFTQNGTYDVTSLAQAVVNVASGGSAQKAEGTFTLASNADMPTITHNLGTTKIAVVVFPITPITYTVGYAYEAAVVANLNKVLEDEGIESFTFDYTSYNSKFTEETVVSPVVSNQNVVAGGRNISPWSTQNNWHTASNVMKKNLALITDTTFRFIDGKFGTGTWKWIAWKLS